MRYLLEKVLIIVSVLVTIYSSSVSASDPVYRMPFSSDQVWNSTAYPWRDNYGVHNDSWGLAFDFYAPSNTQTSIYAPADGLVTKGCNAGNATYVSLETASGDILRLVHLNNQSVGLVKKGDQKQVKQGDYLGKTTGKGVFDTPDCHLSSDDWHVHLSWEIKNCPFKIDGYQFDCERLKQCIGTYTIGCNQKYLNQTFLSTNNSGVVDTECPGLFGKQWSAASNAEQVLRLQVCLKLSGVYDWQNGYTGYFGPYTSDKLAQIRGKKSVSTVTNRCQTLKQWAGGWSAGVASQNVRDLQKCLQDEGLYRWQYGITGFFGNYTRSLLF